MIIDTANINVSKYQSVYANGSSLYVPVKPSELIYAQFDHVKGTAAGPNQQGVSLNRLRLMDRLIDKLVTMKGPEADLPQEQYITADEDTMNNIIDDYASRIRDAIAQTQQSNSYGYAGLLPSPEPFFELQAQFIFT